MEDIITFAPNLEEKIYKARQKQKEECFKSYMQVIESLSGWPDSMLVESAVELAKTAEEEGKDINDGFGNYFLQALAMKNEELALAVDEMIKNGDFPMIENNNE